jgi:putative acetyltransferase
MLEIIKTTSENPDFVALVALLDADLRVRDGEDHAFYAQFNAIARLQHVVVAYESGIPVGCGAFKPFDAQAVEIKRMYVLPENRGKGIAQQVLKTLEAWAAELQYQSCVLETGKMQPEAIALYHRCGYSVIPNYGQYVGIDNSVCFSKSISP